MICIGIITVSDRSSKGLREDLSGPEIKKWAGRKGYSITAEAIVPDEIDRIKERLIEFASKSIDLILTTGGTGFAPRDLTPEATLQVVERIAPGFSEAMRQRSMEITPHAMLSRAVSGILKRSLIINLPGSPKAVRENLEIIEKVLPHAIELLKGQVGDCGAS